MDSLGLTVFSFAFLGLFVYLFFKYIYKRNPSNRKLRNLAMTNSQKAMMTRRIRFYNKLSDDQKNEFEKRVMNFLADKTITGVDTEVSEDVKILVAASAVIPLFTFPYYSYPNVSEVLLYSGSFNDRFETDMKSGNRNILGMVGEGFMNGKVVLSRPDLERAFDGMPHTQNVGIHEFIHIIDKADGAIDGIPEALIEHSYAVAWIGEIEKEVKKIERGKSDIRPYALTNRAEFLAVVSEYFFDNPEKMQSKHPELYEHLSNVFRQKQVFK